MNYVDLVAEVVTLSGRPDLALTDIPLHLRAATLKMHQSDFYYLDIKEATLAFESSEYIQQFEVSSAFLRFRSLSYIRKYNPTGTDPVTALASGKATDFFDLLPPDGVLDSYKLDKSEVGYVAGTTCNLRSCAAFQFALAGWYANPDITVAGYTSWIADQVPYAIVFEATAMLFKSIGFDEQSTKYREMVADQIAIVKQIGLTPKGY